MTTLEKTLKYIKRNYPSAIVTVNEDEKRIVIDYSTVAEKPIKKVQNPHATKWTPVIKQFIGYTTIPQHKMFSELLDKIVDYGNEIKSDPNLEILKGTIFACSLNIIKKLKEDLHSLILVKPQQEPEYQHLVTIGTFTPQDLIQSATMLQECFEIVLEAVDDEYRKIIPKGYFCLPKATLIKIKYENNNLEIYTPKFLRVPEAHENFTVPWEGALLK
jgi:hypothetical protein